MGQVSGSGIAQWQLGLDLLLYLNTKERRAVSCRFYSSSREALVRLQQTLNIPHSQNPTCRLFFTLHINLHSVLGGPVWLEMHIRYASSLQGLTAGEQECSRDEKDGNSGSARCRLLLYLVDSSLLAGVCYPNTTLFNCCLNVVTIRSRRVGRWYRHSNYLLGKQREADKQLFNTSKTKKRACPGQKSHACTRSARGVEHPRPTVTRTKGSY